MKLNELKTPAIILDLDALENNIKNFHNMAKDNDKEIWPMIKTHKSSEIMKMQKDAGAMGVLCGNLDECERAAELGFSNVMYAYPVTDKLAIDRIIKLSKKTNFIIRLDDIRQAELIEKEIKDDTKINYTLIINCGLNRFGVKKEDALKTIEAINKLSCFEFKGISSHPGHVYSAKSGDELPKYVEDEISSLKYVKDELLKNNIKCEIVSSGSTPTFPFAVKSDVINIFHPGNYVYLDSIQISLGIAKESDCALRVLASVISNPEEGKFLIDAGSKCLALDKGAHGNDSIVGHGKIIGHSSSIVDSLSEEVGKLKSNDLKLGERIEIIPNHSCSTANSTSYLYGFRGDEVERIIEVDIRENSIK